MLDCMRRADRAFWKVMKHYERQAGALLKLDKAGRRQRLREIKVETEKSLFALPLSAAATNGLTFDVTAQISSFLELTDSGELHQRVSNIEDPVEEVRYI